MAKQEQATTKKWGANLTRAGFTIIPNHLIAYNQFVGESERLSPTEFFVIAQLLLHWWSSSDKPFPSKSTISNRTGLSTRQIQRTLGSLEDRGFLRRIARYGKSNRGRMSNAYDLEPLVRKLQLLSDQFESLSRAPKEVEASTAR